MADRTRTPKASCADTASVAAAITTKRRSCTHKLVGGKPSPLENCRALAFDARAALASAYRLDEALDSGDTLRLTKLAMQTLESLQSDDPARKWTPGSITEALFDAEAVIGAAATTATAEISAARWALLDRAFLLVDTAISSLPEWEGMEPSGMGERPHRMCIEAASPLEPTPYELAAAWAEEENQNFAMLEAAEKMVAASCPAASALLKLVMDRMRDCVPEEDLLNRLCPEGVLQ